MTVVGVTNGTNGKTTNNVSSQAALSGFAAASA